MRYSVEGNNLVYSTLTGHIESAEHLVFLTIPEGEDPRTWMAANAHLGMTVAQMNETITELL